MSDRFYLGRRTEGRTSRWLLASDREVLRRAIDRRTIPAGGERKLFQFPVDGGRAGAVLAQTIQVEGGVVYQIDDAAASGLIDFHGLALGEDGIAANAIEGA